MNNLDKHAANKHFLKAHRHLAQRIGALLLALAIALAPTVSERAVYAEEAPAEEANEIVTAAEEAVAEIADADEEETLAEVEKAAIAEINEAAAEE